MTEPGYPPPGDLYGGAPPPPPMPPGGAAVPPLPWEDRERRGFFPALFETVKLFVTSPTEAFARAKESGDYLSPILFSVLIGWVATAIGQLYGLLFQGAWLSMLPPEMRDQLGPMMATGGASFILTLILAPVLLLIWFFIWSGIVHLFLMMLGGHKQSSSGFEGTFRAVSYGYVSSLAQLIPFVGGLIAFVWNLVLQVIGLVRMHRTSTGKAVGAVLLPLVLCCVCVAVVFALFLGAIMSAISEMN
jgi:hypothetical protein